MKIKNRKPLAMVLTSLAVSTGFSSLQSQEVVTDVPVLETGVPRATLERSEIFGRSVQGRPIWAHVLGEGPEVTLIFAAVHGNETATPYQVQQLRVHLKRHPYLLKNRRVVLVPVLNPDGLKRRSRVNARGVDINRNYPGTWRRAKRGERFRPGAAPASEPEAQAMIRLTNKYQPHKIVSIHQPLHCIAYSGERSRGLAMAMAKENGYPVKTSVGYPTPGGFGGYCENIIKTPVVTLELPWQSPQAAWQRNSRALLAAIAFVQPRE
jgi:protein MpaA